MRNRVFALLAVAVLLVGVRLTMGGLRSDNSAGDDGLLPAEAAQGGRDVGDGGVVTWGYG